MGADNFGAGGRSVIAYNLTRPLTDAFQVDFLAIGKLKNPSFIESLKKTEDMFNTSRKHQVK